MTFITCGWYDVNMKTKTEFVLTINIGNVATLDHADIADILKKAAKNIAFVGFQDNTHMNLRDLNGNVVGRYGRYTSEQED